MDHLVFIDKINKLGISVRSTKKENEVKSIEIPKDFGKSEVVDIVNFNLSYRDSSSFSRQSPLDAIITKAIDMGSWKHSWHKNITPENYQKFIEIIQEKVLRKSEEIDTLMTVMFQLHHEISKEK